MDVQLINVSTNPVASGSFCMYVMIPVGAIHEDKKQSGCSHILEHMLFRNRQNSDIIKRLTKIGGRYNAITHFDITYFYLRTTSEHAMEAIQIMKDMVLQATFTAEELDVERLVLLEEYHSSPSHANIAEGVGRNALLDPKNIYNRVVAGTKQVIKTISSRELKDYHKRHYKEPVVFIKCDPGIRSRVVQFATRLFGKQRTFQHNDPDLLGQAELLRPSIVVFAGYGPQCMTRMTWSAFPATDFVNGVLLEFINHCLSGTLIYSLLNRKIRVERGLTYTASSFIDKFRYIGFFSILVKSSNNQTDYLISLVLDILEKLKRHGLGSQKLLSYYKNSFISHIKSRAVNESDIEDVALATFYGGLQGREYTKYKLSIVKSITNQSIKTLCNRVFDYEKMGFLTAGRYQNVDAMSTRIHQIINSYYS